VLHDEIRAMSAAPRPWYHLHTGTFAVIIVTALLLSPLGVTAIHALLKTFQYEEGRFTGPVRLLSAGLFLFCLMAIVIAATVSERWHRLRDKPEEKELKDSIEEEQPKVAS